MSIPAIIKESVSLITIIPIAPLDLAIDIFSEKDISPLFTTTILPSTSYPSYEDSSPIAISLFCKRT